MGDSAYKSTLDCFIKTLRNDVCFLTLPLFPLTWASSLSWYICFLNYNKVNMLFGICILQGPLAFYKGFIPNFGRLGSWNVIMFLTLEQVLPFGPCTLDVILSSDTQLLRITYKVYKTQELSFFFFFSIFNTKPVSDNQIPKQLFLSNFLLRGNTYL